MLFFFSNCKHLLRTLPMLQHDENNPEDLDTTAEDHAADALRYGVMSRPWAKESPDRDPKRTGTLADVTLDQLWYDNETRGRGDNVVTRRI